MRSVLVILLLALCGFGAFACSQQTGAEPAATPAAIVVDIDTELNVANQARLAKAIRIAREYESACLIVAMDTPGGDIETMGAMGKSLRDAVEGKSGITTVAFVRSGTFGGAWSAGSFLALACQRIYMEKGANMGAALPVVPAMTPSGFGIAAADHLADGKITNMLSARFREYARQTGRSESIAAAFVDPRLGVARVRHADGREEVLGSDEIDHYRSTGKQLSILREYQPAESDRPMVVSAEVAFETGFSQGTVNSLEDLLATIGRDHAQLIRVDPFPGERLVALISAATPILLLLGIILGFLEAKIPGFGISGVLSSICFALVFYGRYLLGAAEILHGVFFVLGIGLIAVELFLAPGTLYAGILGAILIIGSLAMAFINPIVPRDALDVQFLTNHLAWGSGIFLTAVFVMFILSRFLPKTRLVRRLELAPPANFAAGATTSVEEQKWLKRTGVAVTDLRPAGMIEIDGQRLDAVTEGMFIEKGCAVRVAEVSSNRIVVIPC